MTRIDYEAITDLHPCSSPSPAEQAAVSHSADVHVSSSRRRLGCAADRRVKSVRPPWTPADCQFTTNNTQN